MTQPPVPPQQDPRPDPDGDEPGEAQGQTVPAETAQAPPEPQTPQVESAPHQSAPHESAPHESAPQPPHTTPDPHAPQDPHASQDRQPAPEPRGDQPEYTGDLAQPPPYQGVYGQHAGAPPSPYGRQPNTAPPQPGTGAQPYDPAYGAYDPRFGYGPPGNPQYQQFGGQPTNDDRTMALLCYVGTLLAGFLVPLILYLIKKDQSRFVRFHAAQALNFALTQMIVMLAVIVPLVVVAVIVGHPAVLVVAAPLWLYEVFAPYVWMILGAIRSNRGEWYTLPKWTCFRMVR